VSASEGMHKSKIVEVALLEFLREYEEVDERY
jgi:hypothetical protein